MKLMLTRDVSMAECPWLDRDFAAGDVVYRFYGHTYGCIGPTGTACVAEESSPGPFFELPRSALKGEGE